MLVYIDIYIIYVMDCRYDEWYVLILLYFIVL